MFLNQIVEKHHPIISYTILASVLALLLIPFLGTVHLFDWDEINFAESAREMLVTGNYLEVQINYVPFWEKPPLFFWIQALSMKLFGVNEFAARFPNAIIGIISMLALFNIGNKLYGNKRTGLIWVLVYISSFLPFFYFKSGIIDPLFNLFIFLGIYQFSRFSNPKPTNPYLHVFLSALFIGLATTTKGPVALLIFLLTAFIFMILNKKYKTFLNWRTFCVYIPTFLFFGGLWFILQFLNGNHTVLIDFIEYMIRLFKEEDAGHGGFLAYHFVVLFLGVFPASIFAIRAFKKEEERNIVQKEFKQWMAILFWATLILFTIVNTKIVHYSSLCYYPLTFFAMLSVDKILQGKIKFSNWMKITLSILAFIWGGLVMSLYFIEKYKQRIIDSGIIKDDFAMGNLEANVNWPIAISLIGLLYILFMFYFLWINKKRQIKLLGIFISSLLFVESIMVLVVPRVEQYTQNAAITFYKDKVGKDCYVSTYGFKSYAHYFYTQQAKHTNINSKDKEWLFSEKADKTVYVVCKNTRQKQFEKTYPYFELMETKNGFAFYIHKKQINKQRQE